MNDNKIQTYFTSLPAHKFLHIRNYESVGYWDFWTKQAEIPGQDCDTICALLEEVPGKLDDNQGTAEDTSSGQLMAWINAPEGRICDWGIPLAEAYGVRLPSDYSGHIPEQMQLMDVPEGEYIVFEHVPFDFATENAEVAAQVEEAMADFDYSETGYELDLTPEKVFYFYHDEKRFFKYLRPVKKHAKQLGYCFGHNINIERKHVMDYDAIIIGGGLSGLTAASLLAKRKLKVAVIDKSYQPGGSCGRYYEHK